MMGANFVYVCMCAGERYISRSEENQKCHDIGSNDIWNHCKIKIYAMKVHLMGMGNSFLRGEFVSLRKCCKNFGGQLAFWVKWIGLNWNVFCRRPSIWFEPFWQSLPKTVTLRMTRRIPRRKKRAFETIKSMTDFDKQIANGWILVRKTFNWFEWKWY